MPNLNFRQRDQIVRAVLGTRPAVLAKEADTVALAKLCHTLADAEEAKQILCARGYGFPSQSLVDLVRAVLQRSEK